MKDVLIAIFGSGVGAAVVAGGFMIWQWHLNRKAQKEDRAADKRTADCAERGKEIEQLRNDFGILLSAQKYMMYDRIRHLCETYISRGEITTTELKVLTDMHCCYHDELKGNGFLDGLMDAVKNSVKVIPDGR